MKQTWEIHEPLSKTPVKPVTDSSVATHMSVAFNFCTTVYDNINNGKNSDRNKSTAMIARSIM